MVTAKMRACESAINQRHLFVFIGYRLFSSQAANFHSHLFVYSIFRLSMSREPLSHTENNAPTPTPTH